MLTLRQYAAGEAILRQNDHGETAYIIERGQVEIIKTLPDGQQIHLAFLGSGETFGEMSMIDDKPRSATVVTVEETVVREIHRDAFFQSLQTDPEVGLNLLKILFERLREAHAIIAQFQIDSPTPVSSTPPLLPTPPSQVHTVVFMEGVTPRAVAALPTNPLKITKFPFRIGRQSHDLLAHNDLTIPDTAPLQISRHHLALIKHADRIGVVDRGSTLGALVDDQQLGGPQGNPGPIFFPHSVTSLILGNPHSPFKYNIILKTEEETEA
ncbi:MAG: cyclic nucleotide-binding domain-containing protein [bacterium]|nr:cyclic nucleotide-binding domain-containing protein [bacterium]